MEVKEKYPRIRGCKQGLVLIENLTKKQLDAVEKILTAYGEKIDLRIPRNAEEEVDFEGDWELILKDYAYKPIGIEVPILRWYEGFEDVDYMMEVIQDEMGEIMDNQKEKKTIEVELCTNYANVDGETYASLEFPATRHEIIDAMQRARSDANMEQDFDVINCEMFPALTEYPLLPTTLEEVNYLAKRFAALNEDDEIVLRALTDKIFKDTPEGKVFSVKDLINYTYNLDKVSVISNITTDEQLGQFVIENEGLEGIKNMSDEALQLLDKAALGRKLREGEGGVFEGGRYVITGDYVYEEIYDGENIPYDPIDNDFAFRLLVSKAPKGDTVEDIEEIEKSAICFNLPIDKEDTENIAALLGEKRIEDCVYLEFESAIPQITADEFGDMQKFDTLNELARILDGLEWEDEAKFKAILQAEKSEKIEDILQLAKEIGEYEFDSNCINAESYFRQYLRNHLPPAFDKEWINSVRSMYEGELLAKRTCAKETRYGFISQRGGKLYPLISRHDSNMYLQEMFEKVIFCEKEGLYITNRIPDNAVPQGLYKYEFRGGGFNDLSTLEEKVSVNFTGTLLLREPIDLGEEKCMELNEDNYPEFLEEETTLQEYLDQAGDIKQEAPLVQG